jgi:hypothetical protein
MPATGARSVHPAPGRQCLGEKKTGLSLAPLQGGPVIEATPQGGGRPDALANYGVAGLRQHRRARITKQSYDQGGLLS